MKTILVTGGYGFIGSAFVRQEIAAGNRVINLDKLTYAANKVSLDVIEGSANYQFIKGDVCDTALLAEIFKGNEIDSVVNFAAESHVDNSIEKPSAFIQTNIVGVFALLQSALNYWTQLQEGKKDTFRFLQISTDEVFGSLGDSGKFTEQTPYDPSSPYSASKAAADHLAKAWHKTYGLPVIITNCTNNYGPFQHKEKLIPKIILNALSGKEIPIYGKGENVRDWIFVEDHCAGIRLALEKGKPGESYGFGGAAEMSNNQVAEQICAKLDSISPREDGKSYAGQITYVTDRPGHDWRYAIDDSKARKELGYAAPKVFAERIDETIKHYLAYADS